MFFRDVQRTKISKNHEKIKSASCGIFIRKIRKMRRSSRILIFRDFCALDIDKISKNHEKIKILPHLVMFCDFFEENVKILPGLVMCAWLFLVKRHFCITNSWLLAWLLGFFLKKMAMAFGPFSSKCHGF